MELEIREIWQLFLMVVVVRCFGLVDLIVLCSRSCGVRALTDGRTFLCGV